MISKKICLISSLLSIATILFNPPLGTILLFLSFLTIYNKVLNTISEYVYGIKIRLPIFEECENQAAYIFWENNGKKRRVKVGTALKIIDIKNNVYDLDAYEWINRSKAFLDDSIIDYDVEYKLIYVKHNNNTKYLMGIAVSSSDIQIARNRLFDTLIRIKRNLEGLGIEAKIADKKDLILPIKLEEAKTRWWIMIFIAILSLLPIIKIGVNLITGYLIASFPLSILFGLIIKKVRMGKVYRLLNPIVVVKEDKVAYQEISVEELYKNAINLHNSLNRSIDNYIIIVNVNRLSSSDVDHIKAKFYRMIKWGEAMGKYEMIDEADKYGGLANRSRRGEILYRCKTIIYTDNIKTARYFLAILENIGLKAFLPLTKQGYISIY